MGVKLRKAPTGTIAQLVEQRAENPCVPGSNPGSTTTNPRFGGGFLFAVVGLLERSRVEKALASETKNYPPKIAS